jgi:soluble lytic murein transglycosylase-like protein
MIELILITALEFNLPPAFVLAIAVVENPQFNTNAIHLNNDGSHDRGLMQLNDSWFTDERWATPKVNIRAACTLIKWLKSMDLNWWQVAIAYNCGYGRLVEGNIPNVSIDYANRVLYLSGVGPK